MNVGTGTGQRREQMIAWIGEYLAKGYGPWVAYLLADARWEGSRRGNWNRASRTPLVSISEDRTDRIYRDAIGWPVPAKPSTPVAIVDDLRQLLADLRRRRELQHPKMERDQ